MPLRKPPYAYRHPDKMPDVASEDETVMLGGNPTGPSDEPGSISPPTVRTAIETAEGSVRVRLFVPLVPLGMSERFDALLASGISVKVATLRVLDGALPEYLAALADEAARSGSAPWDEDTTVFETSRCVSSADLRLAKAALDPHSVWRPSEFGRIFGRAIMQHWTACQTLAGAKDTDAH